MFNFKKKKTSEDAQYITEIIEQYSKKKSVRKLISPISDEYYLIDDVNEIYICIMDGKITISNHVFLHKKFYSLSFTDKLKKLVKENIELEMQTLKKTLFNNETDLLSKVLKFAKGAKYTPVIDHNFNTQYL